MKAKKNLTKVLLSSLLLTGVLYSSTSCKDKKPVEEPDTPKQEIKYLDLNKSTLIFNKTGSFDLNYEATYTLADSADKSKEEAVWSSSDDKVAIVDQDGVVTAVGEGNCSIKVVVKNGDAKKETICGVVVTGDSINSLPSYSATTHFEKNINDYDAQAKRSNCPTTGNARILVVPVWFTDSNKYISAEEKETIREDIRKTYFGTDEETGWKSVKGFYNAESFGNLVMDGEVTPWFEDNKASSYYYNNGTVSQILSRVSGWYKTQYGTDKWKSFDANEDGMIDTICLIYGCPDYYTMKNDKASNLWAFATYTGNFYGKVSDPVINNYFWASYDFMYGEKRHVTDYYAGDTTYTTVDTHTYIHEMGHCLGLNDYYDYNGISCVAGAFSMQDYNVGGHDPYSVLMYGWADPIVPTDSCEITIGTFQETHDVILISPNTVSTLFDKYILLELYSPTGLNKFDHDHKYEGRYPNGANNVGIRAWLVDSRLLQYKRKGDEYTKDLFTDFSEGFEYSWAFANTAYNGEFSSRYGDAATKLHIMKMANPNLLQLLRNYTDTNYVCNYGFGDKDLFYAGDIITMSKFQDQFYSDSALSFDLYDEFGSFSIIVKSVSNDSATIQYIKY